VLTLFLEAAENEASPSMTPLHTSNTGKTAAHK